MEMDGMKWNCDQFFQKISKITYLTGTWRRTYSALKFLFQSYFLFTITLICYLFIKTRKLLPPCPKLGESARMGCLQYFLHPEVN